MYRRIRRWLTFEGELELTFEGEVELTCTLSDPRARLPPHSLPLLPTHPHPQQTQPAFGLRVRSEG